MAEGMKKKVQHIVADSAAFLKNAPIHDMCENVYTVEEVVNEIKDEATRQRLAVLPYTLHIRQPSTEALHAGKHALIYKAYLYMFLYYLSFFARIVNMFSCAFS